MKKAIQFILLTIVVGFIISCGLTTKEIITKSRSVRSDIYTEVEDQGRIPPKGFVDLVIKTSIKTHVEGYHIFESSESPHGKPGYPFVFNIDGQGTLWKIDGEKETTPDYDKDGKRDSEGGTGIRYTIEKRIRVKPGSHMIFFALPKDKISVEFQISLSEGRTHVLEFKPLYGSRRVLQNSFLNGISRFEVFLDGAGVR